MQDTTDTSQEHSPALDTDGASPQGARGRVEGLVVGLAPDFFVVAVGDSVYLCTARQRLRKAWLRDPVSAGARRSAADAPGRRGGPSRPLRSMRPARAPETPVEAAPPRPTTIASGDHVIITPLGPSEGVIEDILPRRNAISRARSEMETEHVMMANLDLAALVFAARDPEPRFGLLDRYLALCEHAGIPVLIVLNKVDLGPTPDVEASLALYEQLGYPLVRTSAATGEGLDELQRKLVRRISLLTGPSGVGKSSLMNILIPDAGQRVGVVSETTGKGRHTTTGARLLPLAGGGWLADTAGIRELALWNVPSDELARCFVELRPVADDCEYEDCAHDEDSEGCALRAALADGRISLPRWESFQRLLTEAREKERPRW